MNAKISIFRHFFFVSPLCYHIAVVLCNDFFVAIVDVIFNTYMSIMSLLLGIPVQLLIKGVGSLVGLKADMQSHIVAASERYQRMEDGLQLKHSTEISRLQEQLKVRVRTGKVIDVLLCIISRPVVYGQANTNTTVQQSSANCMLYVIAPCAL